jgi:uncharacterized protein YdhG (YjbR/CyaY superfamily)
MEKAITEDSRKAAKTSVGVRAVEVYLADVPEPARSTLEKVRAVIRAAAGPEATECLSYGMPAFCYKGVLVGYAAFKEHCSFFPMNSALIEQFAEELAGYSTAKGTIRFPLNEPLPASLVKKMVRARVAENERGKKG